MKLKTAAKVIRGRRGSESSGREPSLSPDTRGRIERLEEAFKQATSSLRVQQLDAIFQKHGTESPQLDANCNRKGLDEEDDQLSQSYFSPHTPRKPRSWHPGLNRPELALSPRVTVKTKQQFPDDPRCISYQSHEGQVTRWGIGKRRNSSGSVAIDVTANWPSKAELALKAETKQPLQDKSAINKSSGLSGEEVLVSGTRETSAHTSAPANRVVTCTTPHRYTHTDNTSRVQEIVSDIGPSIQHKQADESGVRVQGSSVKVSGAEWEEGCTRAAQSHALSAVWQASAGKQNADSSQGTCNCDNNSLLPPSPFKSQDQCENQKADSQELSCEKTEVKKVKKLKKSFSVQGELVSYQIRETRKLFPRQHFGCDISYPAGYDREHPPPLPPPRREGLIPKTWTERSRGVVRRSSISVIPQFPDSLRIHKVTAKYRRRNSAIDTAPPFAPSDPRHVTASSESGSTCGATSRAVADAPTPRGTQTGVSERAQGTVVTQAATPEPASPEDRIRPHWYHERAVDVSLSSHNTDREYKESSSSRGKEDARLHAHCHSAASVRDTLICAEKTNISSSSSYSGCGCELAALSGERGEGTIPAYSSPQDLHIPSQGYPSVSNDSISHVSQEENPRLGHARPVHYLKAACTESGHSYQNIGINFQAATTSDGGELSGAAREEAAAHHVCSHLPSDTSDNSSRFSRADIKRRARRNSAFVFHKPTQTQQQLSTDSHNTSVEFDSEEELSPVHDGYEFLGWSPWLPNTEQTLPEGDYPIEAWLLNMLPCLTPSEKHKLHRLIMDSSERAKTLLRQRAMGTRTIDLSDSEKGDKTTRPGELDDSRTSATRRPGDFACFWKTHARSPSDGAKDVLHMLKTPLSPNREKLKSPPVILDEKQGIFQRMFRNKRSQSRERTPSSSKSDTNTSPAKDTDPKSPSKVKQIEVKVKRYRSLSPRPRECPTPPLAIFSSDEDISSVPQTPEHRPGSDDKDLSSGPISPALEEQISKLLLEPPRARSPHHSGDKSSGKKPRPVSIATPTEYPKHKPPTGKFSRKGSGGAILGMARIHSLDSSHGSPVQQEPQEISVTVPALRTERVSNLKVTDPSTAAPCKGYTRYTREFREKRHHTVDLGGIGQMTEGQGQSVPVTLRTYSLGQGTGQTKYLPSTCSRAKTETLIMLNQSANQHVGQRSPQRGLGVAPLALAEIGSNDSGIQQDETPSSSESLRLPTQHEGSSSHSLLRRQSSGTSPTSPAPRTPNPPTANIFPLRERPKSECLSVRWADSIVQQVQSTGLAAVQRRLRRPSVRERPKSDLGSRSNITEVVHEHSRRMSTPQPIKSRHARSPTAKRLSAAKRMKRAKSAPDLLDAETRGKAKLPRKRISAFQVCSAEAGDLAVQPQYCSSDDDDDDEDDEDEVHSEETVSIGAASESSSESAGKQAILEEIFEEESPTFAEALWDHVTMDTEELGFHAGQVVEVMDMTDKDWWWGKIDGSEGWFPAAFVRLRANQLETADDLAQKVKEGEIDSNTALRRYSCNTLLSREQARTNVVKEILHAEKEYIRHLNDVIEGYIDKARKRPEMFEEDRLHRIFGNMEEIYKFSCAFLQDLEKNINKEKPHVSEIGSCFIKHRKGFEIYSEYCNNHPTAIEELRQLQKDPRYHHFFEACRLLQQMIKIPLEGFLLNPVQKICKYPLQLKELLKHTRPEHPDYMPLQGALDTMKRIAMLINERKRKMESLEKLAQWQETVDSWEGPDLLESSSELIYSGEMVKVNRSGRHQERVFFLFDNQLLYCKKDMLWRDLMVYKGRANMNQCVIHPIQDGKDADYGVTVKNAFKIYDHVKDKWFLIYCRNGPEKERWLRAFQEERQRVDLDKQNGFILHEFKAKMSSLITTSKHKGRSKNKGNKQKKVKSPHIPDSGTPVERRKHPMTTTTTPSPRRSTTLPRELTLSSELQDKTKPSSNKKSWFPFRQRKS